ncbi:mgpp2cl-1, protein phosphatase 2C-like protein 1 [Collariella sp. IMI 366227]|nr:mgpp2cl-1, protein phosphatase 2C-like protein 1 [Collariella sp. IMI 366227]
MNILEWAFGKRITPAERLRKNQRLLDKAIRELDQQRVKLEKQEKTLIAQIRQSAQKGQMGACKVQAKDLVRTRRFVKLLPYIIYQAVLMNCDRYVEKFYGMRSQLQKVSLRLQTYRTNEQMMTAMKGATMALGSMNRTMNLPSLQRIAMEFERENDIMEQRQEMMDDAIDDAMDVGLEEEGDEVVEQVLEEIGVDLNQAVCRPYLRTARQNRRPGIKRRSLSAQGGLLNRMFGSSSGSGGSKSDANSASNNPKDKRGSKSPSPEKEAAGATEPSNQTASSEKRSGNDNGSPTSASSSSEQKKRRSSGVSGKASNLIQRVGQSLFLQISPGNSDNDPGADSKPSQTPLQKLGKQDQTLAVPQGQHNNAAGESLPGPQSTFRVGVWEDRNKKCRRTMEDTHAFLYNFLHTPAPALGTESGSQAQGNATGEAGEQEGNLPEQGIMETDNGYFAIFDGHAGTFAADWCGKKLHILLEDTIRKHPNAPIPELLDQTFTKVDETLATLPVKNSGCTAAIAVLRWEDRVPSNQSATGSQAIAPAVARAAEEASRSEASASLAAPEAHARLKDTATRQRVLYTANVGDARIILCRQGKALRLSYDHKGSDENEGRRISGAGGLILNNRVNGVLAVTRALGDTYMKDLVTGHPYTTETVIQPELDEFIIIACDGLWDVCTDQEAVDLVRGVPDPVTAAKLLVDHALSRFSTDNLSCMIVRLDRQALLENQNSKPIGVEGDPTCTTPPPKVSETEKIVAAAREKIALEGVTPVGVSACNDGNGRVSVHEGAGEQGGNKGSLPTVLEGKAVQEEPAAAADAAGEAGFAKAAALAGKKADEKVLASMEDKEAS